MTAARTAGSAAVCKEHSTPLNSIASTTRKAIKKTRGRPSQRTVRVCLPEPFNGFRDLTNLITLLLLLFLRLLKLKMDTSWLVQGMMACLGNFVK